MDDAWDSENFQTPNLKPIASGDKWEGEDEDDDVKDNWEDEEEEKKDEEKQEEMKAFQVKKKKKISEVIEEKERKAREEAARKLAAKEAMKKALTPEEKLAEKLRQQRLQEEADLQVTKETFGVIESTESIDAMNPTTQEEFNNLHEALVKKLQPLSSSVHYALFLENLMRSICASLNATDVKKLKSTIETLYLEKAKTEKAEKSKKNKSKGKAKLMVEGDNEYSAYGTGDYDDFDDFI
ncbi:UNVERIFIED_CONTAM: hypothetical protein PYX00_000234 [Menopon gallinae]|uniref:Eukaryotic translation initiation factor 3 subunit J n=1 Tax=Menopon gallinae TaxID=328185 RepID=A0AAW2I956_9NEOP